VSVTPDIDLDVLRRQFGDTVDRYFDADGDGVADTDIVDEFCRLATSRVRDRLHVYSDAVLDRVREHESYARLLCVVALGERTMSRPEWMLPSGRWPYEPQKLEALAELEKIAKGASIRIAPAVTNDAAPQNRSSRRVEARETVWAGSTSKPTRGGF
jgi:hypothetical protein